MNSSERLKQLVYGQFLHFSHMMEQSFDMELDEFADQAREMGLDSLPNNLTSVHVLDCIGNHEPINNTSIADKLNLSKASITKISAKLLAEGYVKRGQLNDNKKEVYFSLTPKGRRIFEAHEAMHQVMERKFLDAFDSFAEAELLAVLKFFQTMADYLNERQSAGIK
ncbi:MarR family transcriptional regulator [Paenibacillus macerans]|uniref:MarR family transcriptional regulator n=1 Tax=Paenibacillus macerans TaxID=44252 RepID=UPI0020412708|nr:MarR family transcriptional regulator [Paenibacillus macerans]MCM3699476.1 MarR family transcriptional regulator [Paenibacillus macerans]